MKVYNYLSVYHLLFVFFLFRKYINNKNEKNNNFR